MTFWVYILECYKNEKFSCYYTGQTNNFDRRMKQHIQNARTHNIKHITGRFDYIIPVWKHPVKTLKEALELEIKINRLTPDKKKDVIIGRLKVTLYYHPDKKFVIKPEIVYEER